MYPFSAVQFIEPNDEQPKLFAKSRDYVVIMHLTDSIKGLFLTNNMNDEAIEQLFKNFKANNYKFNKNPKMADLEDKPATGTLKLQKQNSLLKGLDGLAISMTKDPKNGAGGLSASTKTIIP